MHNGFVRVQKGEMSEKMSKSLGNFFTVREILKIYDPEVVRFFIVRALRSDAQRLRAGPEGRNEREDVEVSRQLLHRARNTENIRSRSRALLHRPRPPI